jgi:hypothetical protein
MHVQTDVSLPTELNPFVGVYYKHGAPMELWKSALGTTKKDPDESAGPPAAFRQVAL